MFTYIHYMISSNPAGDVVEVRNRILRLPAQPSLSLSAVLACSHSPYLCVAHLSLSLQVAPCGDFAGCKGLCPSCIFLPQLPFKYHVCTLRLLFSVSCTMAHRYCLPQ